SCVLFFFSSRRRHTRSYGDWSSDVCSSDLIFWPAATAIAPWWRAAATLTTGWQNGKSRCAILPAGAKNSCSTEQATGIRRSSKRSEERRVGKEWRGRGEAVALEE